MKLENSESGLLASSPEASLDCTITFRQFAASLPRWVLRCRSGFSSFLARSFKALPSDLGPSSAVFPIPLPCFGLFSGSGPKLSVARWWTLCRKRLIHVLVIGLNYVHFGFRPIEISELGRQPSVVHRAIYSRLAAAVTACDTPGKFPLPPGRAGPEFIARLFDLEAFAKTNGFCAPNQYAEGVEGDRQVVGKISKEHQTAVTEKYSPLRPYRSLEAERLKLSGSGLWAISDFLEDELYLPFREPKVLELLDQTGAVGPSFEHESKDENLKLPLLWSSKGLATLFTDRPRFFCRVFNCHKNALIDRQIGDRRWWNQHEMHPTGPSSSLPNGTSICSIHCPKGQTLHGSISDRKDFYHQCEVTRSRAFTNVLPFKFDTKHFEGTSELSELIALRGKKPSRESDGDGYGYSKQKKQKQGLPGEVYVGFRSLFQGDHLGVEYALSAHQCLLQRGGLLDDTSHVLRGRPFPEGPVWQGLVIDDLFIVSAEPRGSHPLSSESCRALAVAEEIYKAHGVVGSDEKTIRGATRFKIIGAEVQSDNKTQDAGLVTVAAPAEKRFPLAALSLRIASLPIVSRGLASKLAGSWISTLMFRRPMTCILHRLFGLGARDTGEGNNVVPLSRAVADELVVASVFSILCFTDISVRYDPKIYATDASLSCGAITSTVVSDEITRALWLAGDKKGAYSKLDNDAHAILRALGEADDQDPSTTAIASVPRSIDFAFDFVEICGGSGGVSKAAAGLGLIVCTPIDISHSSSFDIADLDLVWWILGMLKSGRFRSMMLEPPCATFSAAQHPSSRSYQQPLGYNRKCPRTLLGNILAFRCILIAWFASLCQRPSLFEQPRLSKMAWLDLWKYLLTIGFEESILASCMCGSIHRKEFRLLSKGLSGKDLELRCSGGHGHVRIEGAYTKASAEYVPGVALRIATAFARSLASLDEADLGPRVHGLESVPINDILGASTWKVERSWTWKYKSHINVYESHALLGLLRHLVVEGGDSRFNALLDSRVAKCAHANGTSSSNALRSTLLKACSYTIAGNLHPSYGFAPTRLNTADAPTRFKDLPDPSEHSILDFLNSHQIKSLQSFQFSRAAAGWIRLYILVAFLLVPGSCCCASSGSLHPPSTRLLPGYPVAL